MSNRKGRVAVALFVLLGAQPLIAKDTCEDVPGGASYGCRTASDEPRFVPTAVFGEDSRLSSQSYPSEQEAKRFLGTGALLCGGELSTVNYLGNKVFAGASHGIVSLKRRKQVALKMLGIAYDSERFLVEQEYRKRFDERLVRYLDTKSNWVRFQDEVTRVSIRHGLESEIQVEGKDIAAWFGPRYWRFTPPCGPRSRHAGLGIRSFHIRCIREAGLHAPWLHHEELGEPALQWKRSI